MTRFFGFISLLLCLSILSSTEVSAVTGAIHHDLNVRLEPGRNTITVEDSILLSDESPHELVFILHSGMDPISPTLGVKITKTAESMAGVPVESFLIRLPRGVMRFVLRYSGEIYQPIEPVGKETARGFGTTAGMISDEGVFLSGGSYWYPRTGHDFVTFTLEVGLPQGWDAVSQGTRKLHARRDTGTYVRWESREPQAEIYLVAARFVEYSRMLGDRMLAAFLRGRDDSLAERYLDAAEKYIAMYDGLIGTYPYGKFALVENFWETGYGMPSFTLLGPKIIRLPFIINSSYPHEILHNWWGNSVYPHPDAGNWAEGLTAYLSDHLIKEQQGAGAEYRRTALQKYADYVLVGRDFPLTEFRSRFSSPSEAVGYGKSMMFFHMLRLELGDDVFIEGLRDFYLTYKFKYASFDDLRKSFEKASRKRLEKFFEQWVSMPGAPELRLRSVSAEPRGKGFVLRIELVQSQRGRPYDLAIPIAVTLENGRPFQKTVRMKRAEEKINIHVPSRPLRLDIDPEFDMFRRLDTRETPPAISRVLGSARLLVIQPGSAEPSMKQAYEALSDAIAASGPDEVETRLDRDTGALPNDRTVVLLGWENIFLEQVMPRLKDHGVVIESGILKVDDITLGMKGRSFVFTLSHPDNISPPILFIASDSADAVSNIRRKLPHYHKYSYLAFEGPEAENIIKGMWSVKDSPMTAFLPDKDGRVKKTEPARLPKRNALASMPGGFSSKRMMDVVRFLSGPNLKGRGIGTPELDRAADYIAERFKDAGLIPGGDNGGWFEEWQEKDEATGMAITMKNVIGVVRGEKPKFEGRSIVIGAHYDHLGMGSPDAIRYNSGRIHPGADDNASGVAVLIELAHAVKKNPPPHRSIVFIAFTGEESSRKGSRHHVSKYTDPRDNVMAMLNLDTVGRMRHNKLLVLGSSSAPDWPDILRSAGSTAGIDIQLVTERLDSSDQMSFEEAGVPAIQLFTGPHLDYHRPSDTADKINPEGLMKVAIFADEVIGVLDKRSGFLTPDVAGLRTKVRSGLEIRKVFIGTIPDFSYAGPGYRLSGVAPGSPAEKAGLEPKDIIIEVFGKPVNGLKDFSDIIKTLKPGDTISIVFIRGKTKMTARVKVSEI